VKFAGIAWTLVVRLVWVVVVFAMFSRATNQFETVILAILVLMYVSQAEQARITVLSMLDDQRAQYARFLELRHAITGSPSDPDEVARLANMKQGVQDVQSGTRYLIDMWANWLIGVIALGHLLFSLI
jgi:hypothetical protein